MKNWFGHWVISVGIAEFFGIGIAAAVTIACNNTVGEPVNWWQKAIVLTAALAAGVAEGWLVGHFQALRLREKLPGLDARSWVKRTILLAAGGWFLGMLPSTFLTGFSQSVEAPVPDPPLWLILLAATGMGLVFGAIFGLVQRPVLRPHLGASSHRWVLANALAWGAGLWLVFLAATLPDGAEPIWLILTGGVLSGLLMGLTVGLITGLFLQKMLTVR